MNSVSYPALPSSYPHLPAPCSPLSSRPTTTRLGFGEWPRGRQLSELACSLETADLPLAESSPGEESPPDLLQKSHSVAI